MNRASARTTGEMRRRGHADRAARLVSLLADGVRGVLEPAERGAHVIVIEPSAVRDLETPRRPLEEADADLGLETLELAARARLRDAERVRGPREASRLDETGEELELLELQSLPIPQR
jgi:hypothetical protein